MALGFGWNWLGGASAFQSPCAWRKERECKMERRLGGQAQGLQDAAVRARASTARGLRAQASGDGWRHVALFF